GFIGSNSVCLPDAGYDGLLRYRNRYAAEIVSQQRIRQDRKASDYGYTGQAGTMKVKILRPELILF
ncbi:MAG: hypothetical protein PVG81_06390, partial [Desulfobacterales bacterium]